MKLTNSTTLFPLSESLLNAEIQLHSRWLWVQLGLYFNDQYILIIMEHFVFPWNIKVFVEWLSCLHTRVSCSKGPIMQSLFTQNTAHLPHASCLEIVSGTRNIKLSPAPHPHWMRPQNCSILTCLVIIQIAQEDKVSVALLPL